MLLHMDVREFQSGGLFKLWIWCLSVTFLVDLWSVLSIQKSEFFQVVSLVLCLSLKTVSTDVSSILKVHVFWFALQCKVLAFIPLQRIQTFILEPFWIQVRQVFICCPFLSLEPLTFSNAFVSMSRLIFVFKLFLNIGIGSFECFFDIQRERVRWCMLLHQLVSFAVPFQTLHILAQMFSFHRDIVVCHPQNRYFF